MNVKTYMATLKISLVLVAFSAGILCVQPVSANPYNPPPFYPSTPNKDPPRIDFQTPVYHESRVQVNFTVTQPDSWIQGTLILCTINQILYEMDDKVVTLFDASTPTAPSRLLKIQPYSIELDATEGQHTMNVRVNTVSAYDSRQNVNWHLFSHIWLNTTQALTFTVPVQNAPSPSPPALTSTLTPVFPATQTSSPASTPAESASGAPTQQSTEEPTLTPDSSKLSDFAPVLIPLGIILLAVVAVSFLVLLSKRKQRNARVASS